MKSPALTGVFLCKIRQIPCNEMRGFCILAAEFRFGTLYLNEKFMKKKTGQLIIIAMAAALAAVSCQKDDTLRYNNVTMGNVIAGTFVSDQGNTFNVVEQTCQGKLDTMKRAILACDVLKATEGATDEYDVRLTKVTSVLEKNPLHLSGITDEDAQVKDPIHIEHIWHSGGYMNLQVIIPIPGDSSSKHLINLVYDDTASNGKSYIFELRHNGFGEVWTENSTDYVLASGYVSFPIGKLISGDSADITLNWRSHKTTENAWKLEIMDRQLHYNWTRDSFEQAPLEIKSKAATDIM